jgi:hypothetical protein
MCFDQAIRKILDLWKIRDQVLRCGPNDQRQRLLIPEVIVPEQLERITVPGNLIPLEDDELQTLHDNVLAAFNDVRDKGPGHYEETDLSYAYELRDGLSRVKAEMSARKVRAEQTAASQALKAERVMNEINESINGAAEGTPEAVVQQAKSDLEREKAIAAAAAQGVTDAMIKLFGDRRGNFMQVTERAPASLGATQQKAPKVDVPKPTLGVTAAGSGQALTSLESLGDAFTRMAGDIPVTQLGRHAPRHKVASIANDFKYRADRDTSPYVLQEYMDEMMSQDGSPALTAAGGWCAPNEIRYNFFNIAEEPSGIVDLPTVGVTRGGLQWPVSPAIGDVFFQAGGSNPASGFGGFAFSFANTSDPWLWSETDDILTVTGSVNKPTLRVPCSSFTSGRLEAYGITLTAGNLTDSAYPEQTQNFLRLLRMAYAHAINARLISLMASASTAFSGLGGSGKPAFQTILDGVELAATDYRNKFAMADDAVLEVILPRYVLAVIRADLAWRTRQEGSNSVPDSTIRSYFTDRGVRAQFVSDYQVRGSGQFGNNVTTLTTWPTTADMLIYAPGTFLHGQGMSLDLGVVRDSVLNAENDFTAAWAEETHMIAKVGHESRKYTITYGVAGAGTADLSAGAQL